MIAPSEENQDETPGEPGEFEYEVVDPDAPPRSSPDGEHDLTRGREELNAIEEEMYRGSGPLARWGALLMLVGLIMMLLLPRLGCTLKQRPDQLSAPSIYSP
jgi:hypothetical protein